MLPLDDRTRQDVCNRVCDTKCALGSVLFEADDDGIAFLLACLMFDALVASNLSARSSHR